MVEFYFPIQLDDTFGAPGCDGLVLLDIVGLLCVMQSVCSSRKGVSTEGFSTAHG